MSDRHIDSMVPEGQPQAPQVLSTARPEEGTAKGEGGIAIVSYVMMTLANVDS
jgi:hypothetical protein